MALDENAKSTGAFGEAKSTSVQVAILADDIDKLTPEFNIHEERSRWMRLIAITLSLTLLAAFLTNAFYISGGKDAVFSPNPDFIENSFLAGYRHEFYSLQKTFKDANAICHSRGGLLVYFNSTEEHSKFNAFVVKTFKPHVDNRTTNWYAKRALQIWTGIRIAFKAQKKAQLVWPGKIEASADVMKFYDDSQNRRICILSSYEQLVQISKALGSKLGEQHYIVKDFSDVRKNVALEPGCWQIRILDDSTSLYLPFACKIKT